MKPIFDASWQNGTADGMSRHSVGLENAPLIHLANRTNLSTGTDPAISKDEAQRHVDYCLENKAILCLADEWYVAEAKSRNSTEAERDAALDFWAERIDLIRSCDGGQAVRIGIYQCVGRQHPHDADQDEWIRRLARMGYDRDNASGQFAARGLFDRVDFHFPSLYFKSDPTATLPAKYFADGRTDGDWIDWFTETLRVVYEQTGGGEIVPFIRYKTYPEACAQLMQQADQYVQGWAIWRNPAEAWGGDSGVFPPELVSLYLELQNA